MAFQDHRLFVRISINLTMLLWGIGNAIWPFFLPFFPVTWFFPLMFLGYHLIYFELWFFGEKYADLQDKDGAFFTVNRYGGQLCLAWTLGLIIGYSITGWDVLFGARHLW